ncbi:GTPase IMAP family member 8-like, partial [Nelusetta ayraudi]|uniref:GTPase IMAP family member 8-like n=1 Tax=Nelusetta ayraudi TaxID=303726 RepID=UPI003F71CAC7
MNKHISLIPPGPNVLLLLVKPSDFTEETRKTLKFILFGLLGQNVLQHSMVIRTHEEEDQRVDQLIEDCGGRWYRMTSENHQELMEKIANVVDETRVSFLSITEDFLGSFLSITEDSPGSFLSIIEDPLRPKSERVRPALNLVLCGRRGAGKTSAAEVILSQKLHSVSSSSQWVQGQAEVSGRWLSLLELPALYGKPQQEVMEVSLRCVSHCDPEDVHAFILVLPVGPLTDEDKGELETIQNTFGCGVKDFIILLFTVESHPEAPAVDGFIRETGEVQELLQKFGGRHVVLSMKDQQQIPELLDTVERIRTEGSR